jgi:DNA-binding transcriptional ArsR family regulator
MPRAATTSDAFNAIAETRRREIVDLLSRRDRQPVNTLVEALGLPQPAVSKHLAVLRKVGLVSVHKEGQQRLYSLNPEELKVVHDWVKLFERFWLSHLHEIKESAEKKAQDRAQRF